MVRWATSCFVPRSASPRTAELRRSSRTPEPSALISSNDRCSRALSSRIVAVGCRRNAKSASASPGAAASAASAAASAIASAAAASAAAAATLAAAASAAAASAAATIAASTSTAAAASAAAASSSAAANAALSTSPRWAAPPSVGRTVGGDGSSAAGRGSTRLRCLPPPAAARGTLLQPNAASATSTATAGSDGPAACLPYI